MGFAQHLGTGKAFAGVAACVAVGVCAAGLCQSSPPAAAPAPAPELKTVTLPVLPPARMSAADAALLSARELDVSKAAAFYGFDISDSNWTYEQIVCRSLPDHLILSFSNAVTGRGPSRFVAVVPHGPQEVQAVPGYSRGLLPFRPVWKNGGSYAVFNRMVETDRGTRALSPDSHWLNLAMCYAALTGSVPVVSTPQEDVAGSEALVKRRATIPTIHLSTHGAADVSFSDLRSPDTTVNWTLSFDRNGRLTHAERSDDHSLRARVLSPATPPVPLVPE